MSLGVHHDSRMSNHNRQAYLTGFTAELSSFEVHLDLCEFRPKLAPFCTHPSQTRTPKVYVSAGGRSGSATAAGGQLR
jgi:hypothetical protein